MGHNSQNFTFGCDKLPILELRWHNLLTISLSLIKSFFSSSSFFSFVLLLLHRASSFFDPRPHPDRPSRRTQHQANPEELPRPIEEPPEEPRPRSWVHLLEEGICNSWIYSFVQCWVLILLLTQNLIPDCGFQICEIYMILVNGYCFIFSIVCLREREIVRRENSLGGYATVIRELGGLSQLKVKFYGLCPNSPFFNLNN